MTRLQEVEKLLDSNLQLITDYTKRAAELIGSVRQLAECQNSIEHTAYIHGKGGGYMQFGKQNIDFLTGWLGNPEREDYEP